MESIQSPWTACPHHWIESALPLQCPAPWLILINTNDCCIACGLRHLLNRAWRRTSMRPTVSQPPTVCPSLLSLGSPTRYHHHHQHTIIAGTLTISSTRLALPSQSQSPSHRTASNTILNAIMIVTTVILVMLYS